jgi:hypothetical protein
MFSGVPSIPFSRISGSAHKGDVKKGGDLIEESLSQIDPRLLGMPEEILAKGEDTSGFIPGSVRPLNRDDTSQLPGVDQGSVLDRRLARSPSPRPFGGILTALTSLNSLPINPTPRNAELFNFCKFSKRPW